ncbi:MAG: TIGR02646 family protein [Rhodospirillaceae bacterium]|nr:TIGR02646 family protein [Rhodospirillaceae bacterium]
MKRIRVLPGPVHGMAVYQRRAAGSADWEGFRRTRAHTALLDELESLQHGLCAYCETRLVRDDRQVEHVVPTAGARGAPRVFDPANLVACCLGGTNRPLQGAGEGGASRFRDPPGRDQSCGQAKGDSSIPGFLDPRTLPASPSILRVGPNGKIRASPEACATAGVDPDRVRRTIRLLNLNSERLRTARKIHWDALEDEWKEDADDGLVFTQAARAELLPDEVDRLHGFFTTRRSFFGSAGERILAEPPQDWI